MKTQSTIYPCIYIDQQGELHCEIENKFTEGSFAPLSLKIEDLHFKGSSFDDFELINRDNYTKEQLNRFTFNKLKTCKSNNYVLELCNCELYIEIPILLVNTQNNTTINTKLSVDLTLGLPATNGGIDFENAIFRIDLQNKCFISEGDVFEDALIKLQNQFQGKYHFKNCFGCLYSDYSPYGNGFFGDLICFRNFKEDYLNANSKSKLLNLMEKDIIIMQETYCCYEFKQRPINTGYRG